MYKCGAFVPRVYKGDPLTRLRSDEMKGVFHFESSLDMIKTALRAASFIFGTPRGATEITD